LRSRTAFGTSVANRTQCTPPAAWNVDYFRKRHGEDARGIANKPTRGWDTVTVPGVILTESVLSFLGLGVQEPMTSWGVLIQDGVGVMESAPWILLFPAALLSITLYCINFVGDGLRDALDPKDR